MSQEGDDVGRGVLVPDTRCPLTVQDFEELQQAISPSAHSDNYGIDLYLLTLSFVLQKLQQYH